jgi:hypothetical protein
MTNNALPPAVVQRYFDSPYYVTPGEPVGQEEGHPCVSWSCPEFEEAILQCSKTGSYSAHAEGVEHSRASHGLTG